LQFSEVATGRGLRWNALGEVDAVAAVAIGQSKIAVLDGAEQATIEVVVRIEASSTQSSRLVHFGSDIASGRFTLSSDGLDDLNAAMIAGPPRGVWQVDGDQERHVYHLVFDRNGEVTPGEPLLLYEDGTAVAGTFESLPGAIDLQPADYFTLGNREIGDRSFIGEIYYAAVYAEALAPQVVRDNADALALCDDDG
jgi:hypothetical protein